MSSTDSVGGVQETRAQAYARALEVWGQWLRQWRRTGAPRALHAALTCKQISSERFAAWRAELRADRSARQSMRVARTERALDQMLVQIRRDEEAIEFGARPRSGRYGLGAHSRSGGVRQPQCEAGIPWSVKGPRS